MIEEDYVSFETAKLLKEKGFEKDIFKIPCLKVFKGNRYGINGEDFIANDDICIPTLQMAIKWLREVHNKSIEVRSQGLKATGIEWVVEVYNLRNQDMEYHPFTFSTYEEACESAIKYCLENLI